MKYAKEIAIIFCATLAGEVLNMVLPLPIPAGVYGLFILLAGLCTKVIKIEDVDATGNFLLDTMPMMFIPVSVSLMENFDSMKAVLVPLLVIIIVSTVFTMAVTGKITEIIIKKSKKGEE